MPDPTSGHIPFLDLAAINAEAGNAIQSALDSVIHHHRFINGPEAGEFACDWAGYCGVHYAVGTSNGTTALEALLRCDGIGPGDEVILPSHTFIATVESIAATGARPVFADIDPATMLMDPASVESVVTSRTAAVVAVHLYGAVVPWNRLEEVADRWSLALYEDAAQAHGATWRGRRAGSLGRGAAFSFFPGKNLGAFGDAGAVTTGDAHLGERVRAYVNHGRLSKYTHDFLGANARIDTLQAAVLRAKLPLLDGWNERRRTLAAAYDRALEGTGFQPQVIDADVVSARHLYVVRCPVDRDRLRPVLDALGVGTGIHYPVPCHLQRACAHLGGGEGSLPATEAAAASILSLPMCPTLGPDVAGRVCEALVHASRTLGAAST